MRLKKFAVSRVRPGPLDSQTIKDGGGGGGRKSEPNKKNKKTKKQKHN